MIEIKQTLESLTIQTADGELFNELRAVVKRNFTKTLGQKDKIISFYDENELAQRKYFFKFLSKICEKYDKQLPNLFLSQYSTIKLNYKQINCLKVVIFADLIFADGNVTLNLNSTNELFMKYVSQKFKNQKTVINDKQNSICIFIKDPQETRFLDELLSTNEHMKFSVFFDYDKDDFVKFKRNLNVKNSQKFVRRFTTLVELFKEQFELLGCSLNDSFDDVRSSYLALVKLYHPDRHANKSEKIKLEYRNKFEKIQNAYESVRMYFKEQDNFVNAM
ncbi:MAG: adenylosuccinate lyase [Campylobacter sp.]